MRILNLNDIIELKKLINDNFETVLHIHDTCGGQYFSTDKKSKKLQNFIKKYMASKNLKARFDETGFGFFVE